MNYVIILSGGVGSRMKTNGIPKQYLPCHGRAVICYPLVTFDRHPSIDGIVIVADEQWRAEIGTWMEEEHIQKFLAYADPGENRQLSIRNGLRALVGIAKEADAVIIHDAARPLVSAGLISRCLEALPGSDGVMPYLPAKDTFYLLGNSGLVAEELPRERLAAGQAPEAFRFGKYLQINEALSHEDILKISGSTQIALRNGLKITAVPGEERDFKITTSDDMLLLEKYMEGDAL